MIAFNDLRDANARRADEIDDRKHAISYYSGQHWVCGLASELGEVADIIQDAARGKTLYEDVEHLAEEIADVVIYADLLAQRYGINLGDAVRRKFNKTSEKLAADSIISEFIGQ